MKEGYIATIITKENPRRTWIAAVPRVGEQIFDEATDKLFEVKAIQYKVHSVGMGEDEESLKPSIWSDFSVYTKEIGIDGYPIEEGTPSTSIGRYGP